MNTTLDEDLDDLSKKLYLESPDLWIEFAGKITDKVFDEMVLFFAIKYNMLSIIEYAVDNKKINLNDESKNKSYSSVKEHLIATAKQYNCDDILSYLGNPNKKSKSTPAKSLKQNSLKEPNNSLKESNNYSPSFTCPKCSNNIFDCGYKIVDNTIHKFSTSENKIVKNSDSNSSCVICCNCNTILNDTTPDKLDKLCSVQTCNNCGSNLTEVGILDKVKMEYDKDKNKFISKSTSYHCCNCDELIKESQKIHFNL